MNTDRYLTADHPGPVTLSPEQQLLGRLYGLDVDAFKVHQVRMESYPAHGHTKKQRDPVKERAAKKAARKARRKGRK